MSETTGSLRAQGQAASLVQWLGALDRRHAIMLLCLATAFAAVVLRFPLLFDPGWSVDSYTNWTATDVQFVLAQGRPAQWLLWEAISGLGVDRNAAAVILQPLGLALFAFSAPLIFIMFAGPRRRVLLAALPAALVFVLHPYQTEILTFPESSFYAHAASAAGIFGLYAARRGGRWLWAGVATVVLALGTYQLVLNYLAVALLGGLGFVGWSGWRQWRQPGSTARQWLNGLLCTAGGVLGYLVLNAIVLGWLGLTVEGRGTMIGLAQVPARAAEFVTLLGSVAGLDLIVDAPVVRWSFALLLVAGFAGAVIALARRRPLDVLGGLALLGLMLVAAAGVVLVGVSWWPVPRVLGGYALVAGWLVFVLARYCLPHSSLRRGLVAVLTVTLLGFVSIGAVIHEDQKLVNRWDLQLASSIHDRAAMLVPADGEVKLEIANVHMRWSHPVALRSLRGDMNMSAFFVQGSVPNVFRLATGHPVQIVAPSPETIALCEQSRPWPATTAIARVGETIRVCL